MFTVEFETDATIITSLDESDNHEDVEVIIGDDSVVFIRQFEDGIEQYQLITMSYQQLLDLFMAMQQTEGMYKIEVETNK